MPMVNIDEEAKTYQINVKVSRIDSRNLMKTT